MPHNNKHLFCYHFFFSSRLCLLLFPLKYTDILFIAVESFCCEIFSSACMRAHTIHTAKSSYGKILVCLAFVGCVLANGRFHSRFRVSTNEKGPLVNTTAKQIWSLVTMDTGHSLILSNSPNYI